MKEMFFYMFIGFLGLIFIGLIAGAVLVFYLSRSPEPMDAQKLTEVVNNWRVSQGFQPYEEDPFLCAVANQRALEIETDWSHDGAWKYIERTKHKKFGENLVTGYSEPQAALEGWLNSPLHKKNLDDDYKNACIRCNETYCAQEFANF